MPVPLYAGSIVRFIYTDDFGTVHLVGLKDYIGDAGGLERYDYKIHEANQFKPSRPPHLRHLRIRSIKPDADYGRKLYKDIPVQEINPLWTGPLGQQLRIAETDFEVINKIDEIEYGVKGAAARRRALKIAKKALPST